MTKSEIIAFNDGAMMIITIAERTAEALKPQLAARPTRIGFAVSALEALAEEGRSLLKPDGHDGIGADPGPSPAPRPPKSHGYELVVPAHAGDDGNFGLTEAEIMRPSREIIIDWLKGRTPMVASHWSKIAARMLAEQIEPVIIAAE